MAMIDPLRFCRPKTQKREERESLIAKAAYLRAERRCFEPGHELDDWLAAKAQVDDGLSKW
jgi:hypothetical protein